MVEELRHALPKGYRLDEYEVLSVLGHGGFGITYLAHDTRLDTEVAIKEYIPVDLAVREDGVSVHPRSEADREEFHWGLDRFLREAQTLARFKHPNIVPVLRFFEANGTAYLVMEYQEGESLSSLLKRKQALGELELWPVLIPLLDGLAEVHKAGFLHRDIKPGNIYLRGNGSPVLLDFGTARQAIGRKSKSLTAIVTAGYAPYEQYESDGDQGPWTDIYSLAAVLYRAVTGAPPVEAPSRAGALARGKDDPMVPVASAAQGKCSPRFLSAIDRGLAILEKDRPQSIEDWRDFIVGGRGATTSAGTPRNRSAAVAVAALLVLLVFGGGSYALWQYTEPVTGTNESTTMPTAAKTEPTPDTTGGAGVDETANELDRQAAAAKARRRAEEEDRRRAEEETRRQVALEERIRLLERRAKEAEDRARAAAAEAQRQVAEEAANLAAAEAKRSAAEAKAKRESVEVAQREAEAERAARRKAEAKREAKRKAEAELEAKRKAEAEREAKRKAEAEAEREAKRKAALPKNRAPLTSPVETQQATRTARAPDPSSPEDLKALFSGVTLYARNIADARDEGWKFESGGALVGSYYVLTINQHREDEDRGRWWVKDAHLCFHWRTWFDGREQCFSIAVKNNRVVATNASGAKIWSGILDR